MTGDLSLQVAVGEPRPSIEGGEHAVCWRADSEFGDGDHRPEVQGDRPSPTAQHKGKIISV